MSEKLTRLAPFHDGMTLDKNGEFLYADEVLPEIERLNQEIALDKERIANLERLLNAIPPCRAHGKGCIPHAIEWVERIKLKRGQL